jgi:hypothetical protein
VGAHAEALVDPNANPFIELFQFGALGIVVVLFVIGFIVSKSTVQNMRADYESRLAAEREDRKAIETERAELVKLYQTEVIPLLTQLHTSTVPMLQKLQAEMHDLQVERNAVARAPNQPSPQS